VVRASDRSFQVKWTETAYDRGSLVGSTRWTAMLSVDLKPPKSADVLRRNPLGLYVDAIDWSRELESAADHPGNSAAAPQPSPLRCPAPQPSLPPPIRCLTRARPFPPVGEPPMSALSFLTSLLAAAAVAPTPTPASAAEPEPTAKPKPPVDPETLVLRGRPRGRFASGERSSSEWWWQRS
jgi:hypothetical protein